MSCKAVTEEAIHGATGTAGAVEETVFLAGGMPIDGRASVRGESSGSNDASGSPVPRCYACGSMRGVSMDSMTRLFFVLRDEGGFHEGDDL